MQIDEIAARLTEERERLGYTKAAFARLVGVSSEAMRLIEAGKSDFKASLLAASASAGADVQYILTGVRSRNTESVEGAVGYTKNIIQGGVSGVGFAQNGSNVQVINTTRLTQKTTAVTNPGAEHITPEQRVVLKDLVDQVVEREAALKKTPKTHRAVWAALNKHCGVPTYPLIKVADFDKARKYLHMWIGRLNAAPSAPVVDGDAWRKRHYAYIKVNSKDPSEAQALRNYMARKFDVDSLTLLANDELEAVYRYVAQRKRSKK